MTPQQLPIALFLVVMTLLAVVCLAISNFVGPSIERARQRRIEADEEKSAENGGTYDVISAASSSSSLAPIEIESSSKVIRRYEILSLVGSGLLFVSSYFLYAILEYISATYGVYALPKDASFSVPIALIIPYYVALATGFGSIGTANTILGHWLRPNVRAKDPYTISVKVQDAKRCFLFSYSFVGALFVVFLQPFVHYVPLGGPFNSLEWQIGPFGWFFGLLSMLAGVPVTAVNVLFSIRKSIKKVKLCNRSASFYALCSVVATLSFLALTASFLLGGLGS